ncbi:hypothetical protein V490_00187, partial [Pseudogymnoascus sp. VKM F-3557]
MFFSLPTIALVASLLSSTALAVAHNGHRRLHAAERAAALVDRDVTVVNTQTDWVTVWWDGTSLNTPTATVANAAQAAVDAAHVNAAAEVKAAATTAAPAPPQTTAAPVAPATTLYTVVAPAVTPAAAVAAPAAVADTSAANAAANAAAAAANPDLTPEGIVGNIVSVVSSVVAPIVATPTPVVVIPPATGNDGPKRGIAYNNADLVSSFTGADSKVSWAYNWGSHTPSIPSNFEYVPMLWGTGSDYSADWNEAATAAIASGSKHLL